MNDKAIIEDTENQEGKHIPDEIDYKDINFLKRFISETGKINPRRSGILTGKEQRKINKKNLVLCILLVVRL